MNASLEPSSRADLAYDRLRGEILQGSLMPEDRLRAVELQERFQLGLTPIREALTRLATEGLVETESNRGFRVTAASAEGFADLMRARRQIEALCLTQAIERGDAAWEAEILAAMHLLSRTPLPASPDDRAAATQWETQHRRFHLALVAGCGSEWLLRFWSMLTDHSERYRKIRVLRHQQADASARDVEAEHRAVMAAAIDRDADRAVALMEAHLQATEQAVMRYLAG